MPYVSEKIKIQNTKYDRKIKITKEIREEIKKLYSEGKTQTYIAKLFGVDRKTIYNVLNEDIYQAQLKRRREEKAHLTYYDRERHTKYIREHRKYKQKLYLEGKINMYKIKVLIKYHEENVQEIIYNCKSEEEFNKRVEVLKKNGKIERAKAKALNQELIYEVETITKDDRRQYKY